MRLRNRRNTEKLHNTSEQSFPQIPRDDPSPIKIPEVAESPLSRQKAMMSLKFKSNSEIASTVTRRPLKKVIVERYATNYKTPIIKRAEKMKRVDTGLNRSEILALEIDNKRAKLKGGTLPSSVHFPKIV